MVKWLRFHYPDAIDGDTITIPIDQDAAANFFASICSAATGVDLETNSVTSPKPFSVSYVVGYRSALVGLYKAAGHTLDPKLDNELSQPLLGFERITTRLKKAGELKAVEGKYRLKFCGYQLLGRMLMTQSPSGKATAWSSGIFSWCYLLLAWNLMSRGDLIDTLQWHHIDWCGDSLCVVEQGHKGDQVGAEKYDKHVYANPFHPEICPVLALAVLVFSSPARSRGADGCDLVFVRRNNSGRFGKALRTALLELSPDEVQELGSHPDDIGVHSLRKGSSTFALGGVCGPYPVTVFLRMGHSLGTLKDRYIHHAEGADQLCGRVVAGLPSDAEDFGVLPPHFHPETSKLLTVEFWRSVFSDFDSASRGLQSALQFLLASLIHHEAFLRKHLDAEHPIFASRVFTHNTRLPHLRGKPAVCRNHCEATRNTSTGVPPHVLIASRIRTLESAVQVLTEATAKRARTDDPAPSRGENRLADADRVVERLLDQVTGILQRVSGNPHSTQRTVFLEEPAGANNSNASTRTPVRWKTWVWEENEQNSQILHNVPQAWRFPHSISTKTLWDLWYFGDQDQGVRSLRLLTRRTDIKKVDAMRHSRAKAVISKLEEVASKMNLIDTSALSRCSIEESDRVFTAAYTNVVKSIYGESALSR